MKELDLILLKHLKRVIKSDMKKLACVRTKKKIILSNTYWLLEWPLKMLSDDVPLELLDELEKNDPTLGDKVNGWIDKIFPNGNVRWVCEESDPTKKEIKEELVPFMARRNFRAAYKKAYIDAFYDCVEDISFKMCVMHEGGYLLVLSGEEIVGAVAPVINSEDFDYKKG